MPRARSASPIARGRAAQSRSLVAVASTSPLPACRCVSPSRRPRLPGGRAERASKDVNQRCATTLATTFAETCAEGPNACSSACSSACSACVDNSASGAEGGNYAAEGGDHASGGDAPTTHTPPPVPAPAPAWPEPQEGLTPPAFYRTDHGDDHDDEPLMSPRIRSAPRQHAPRNPTDRPVWRHPAGVVASTIDKNEGWREANLGAVADEAESAAAAVARLASELRVEIVDRIPPSQRSSSSRSCQRPHRGRQPRGTLRRAPFGLSFHGRVERVEG